MEASEDTPVEGSAVPVVGNVGEMPVVPFHQELISTDTLNIQSVNSDNKGTVWELKRGFKILVYFRIN